MRLPIYQVDAFTDTVFRGNPAAIVPLQSWLPDAMLQAIAAENNLAETAFFVPQGSDGRYHLRWFTPEVEVDLCGHATLASAWLLLTRLVPHLRKVEFETRSGLLPVTLDGETGRLEMDFPARIAVPANPPPALLEGLGAAPAIVLESAAWLAVYESADQLHALKPDMARLATLEKYGVIATAPGDRPGVDCVSRFFAPRVGVPEDPVTGSAHCTIVPYWATRLGRSHIHAYQASKRGGHLFCRFEGERVRLAGSCMPYLEGSITV
ncbi:PhzF family phenazine biosynthesis protein [Ferrovibrio sp.]|uniref:PhzF family phenazine biosynthesis protein n=1 Tax=Ferrovibrio sp. TaxID=1917215 RepID=UPI0035B31B8A